VAANGLALVIWVSLVGADPLLDPWQLHVSEVGKTELAPPVQSPESESWQLDDDGLLNPFEQD